MGNKNKKDSFNIHLRRNGGDKLYLNYFNTGFSSMILEHQIQIALVQFLVHICI